MQNSIANFQQSDFIIVIIIEPMPSCLPLFFYTHPISFLTKKLEYRKVFFPSNPMNQIESNHVRSPNNFNVKKKFYFQCVFYDSKLICCPSPIFFFRVVYSLGVSVIFMTRHKMGQVLSQQNQSMEYLIQYGRCGRHCVDVRVPFVSMLIKHTVFIFFK